MKRQQLRVQAASGYQAGPPWIFSGRAIYQLHLVKAEVARKFVPSDLSLVQAFGYTLGGLYLAKYDDSPAGPFDELVVIAGTVWNPPTSCAWAARVLVNSLEAREHGKKEVGLPSRLVEFSEELKPVQQQGQVWWSHFSRIWTWHCRQHSENRKQFELDVVDLDDSYRRPLCQFVLPEHWAIPKSKKHLHGPVISLSLPSFSGRTKEQPELLKYTCQLKCSVKIVKPAVVTTAPIKGGPEAEGDQDLSYKLLLRLLGAKPVLALWFENMMMHVEAATVVDSRSKVSPKAPNDAKSCPTTPVKATI